MTVQESIETWEEACAVSQEWADGARQAAVKRRQLRHALMLLVAIVLILLSLFLVLS